MQRAATHLMFTGEASEALQLYAATFPEFTVGKIERYGPGQQGPEGTVMRADASLGGHRLIIIDSPVRHAFTFTAAMSLFVDCSTVSELEAAFAALSAGGQVFMPIDNYGFS